MLANCSAGFGDGLRFGFRTELICLKSTHHRIEPVLLVLSVPGGSFFLTGTKADDQSPVEGSTIPFSNHLSNWTRRSVLRWGGNGRNLVLIGFASPVSMFILKFLTAPISACPIDMTSLNSYNRFSNCDFSSSFRYVFSFTRNTVLSFDRTGASFILPGTALVRVFPIPATL